MISTGRADHPRRRPTIPRTEVAGAGPRQLIAYVAWAPRSEDTGGVLNGGTPSPANRLWAAAVGGERDVRHDRVGARPECHPLGSATLRVEPGGVGARAVRISRRLGVVPVPRPSRHRLTPRPKRPARGRY